MILDLINLIYAPMDWIIPIVFFYCTSFLQTLTVGIIGVLTIGKILSIWKTKLCTFLKWFMYIYYLGYTLYSLGIFRNLLTLNILDWTTFVLSVIAPICMVVLGKVISNAKIKGYRIFTYITIMLLYLFISWLWFLFSPKTVNFTILFFVWIFALVVVGAVSIINHFRGDDQIEKK